MPQAAGEDLLQHLVQGLRPPIHPGDLLVAPDHPPPGMGHWRPTGSTTTPPPPDRESKGRPRQGVEERPKVAGTGRHGQGTGGNTTRGRETTNRPGKGEARGRGTRGERATTSTRAHTQDGHATTDEPAPPGPQSTPHDPQWGTSAKPRCRNTNLTPQEPHRIAPTGLRTPHRGRRVHPHEEKGLHPPGKPPRTPRTPPPHPKPPGKHRPQQGRPHR